KQVGKYNGGMKRSLSVASSFIEDSKVLDNSQKHNYGKMKLDCYKNMLIRRRALYPCLTLTSKNYINNRNIHVEDGNRVLCMKNRCNFKATVTDTTADGQFSFFTPAGMEATKNFEDGLIEAAEKEKMSKLIQAVVKEKKNWERQRNRCYKRRMDAKLFWKKFVVASQPTKKLWISLGKRFKRLSFQE
nr:hypothetical protein [Tanacetum cinerariifolium]